MLTEKSIKLIEDATGIDGLQDLIASDEVKDITLKKTKHFSELDYNILYSNLTEGKLTDEKKAELKLAGEEVSVKEIKRKHGFDFEGKSVEKLTEYLMDQIELKSKSESSEIEKQYLKDIEQLKKNLSEKDNKIIEIENKRKTDKINAEIDSYFNSLRIEVPSHIKDEEKRNSYIQKEIEKNKIYFKSQYQFDLDENGNVITKDSKGVIKDDTLSPVKVSELVNKFTVENFVPIETQIKGRGEGDRLPVNGNIASIKNADDLMTYAEKQGVKKNTKEFDALYIEWQKNLKN
jgi:hypothetical protein